MQLSTTFDSTKEQLSGLLAIRSGKTRLPISREHRDDEDPDGI